jgi:hypothetical protein
MKVYFYSLIFILSGSNCLAQEQNKKDSSTEKSLQLSVTLSPTFQFFTNNRDKITGHSIALEFPALTVFYKRLMLSVNGVYGSGLSKINMTVDNSEFTTDGGNLNFFQYKMQFGYAVLKSKSFKITPYAGLFYGELIGEKNAVDKNGGNPGYHYLLLFPNYTLGVMMDYDLSAKFSSITKGKSRLRHYLRLNIGYNFLDPSATLQTSSNAGLPQRMKEIGIGWGVYLTE